MPSKDNVLIIGAGKIGTAIARLIRKNAKTAFFDVDPTKVPNQKPLSETAPSADVIFLCVPSWAVPEALGSLKKLLNKRTVAVSISKGLAKNGETLDMLYRRLLPPGQPLALLSGPMLAEEIIGGLGGAAVAASGSATARGKLARLFRGSGLRVSLSKDTRGVALAGVIKNIYALSLGAAEGMSAGYNARGLLITQAVREMEEIIRMLGGDAETACGPAGLGDLVATGFSPSSRNHEVGRAFAQGSEGPRVSEGTVSLPVLVKRLGNRAKRFPLLAIVRKILQDPRHGTIELKKFIAQG